MATTKRATQKSNTDSQRLTRVEGKVDTLDHKVDGLRSDFGVLKQDVGGLKQDVSGLKKDVSGLKQDVGVLKQDVGTLKQEMSEVKSTVLDLKLDATEAKAADKEIFKELRWIHNSLLVLDKRVRFQGDLPERVSQLEGDNHDLKLRVHRLENR